MDGYGVAINTGGIGSGRYRTGDTDTWDLTEAEAIAYEKLNGGRRVYVTFGNGEHEFRMWDEAVDEFGNFTHPGIRWAEWYVDVEISGHRWRYRPVADLDDAHKADGLATLAAELYPDVTRIWVGRSDGSEEYESDLSEEG